MNGVSGLFGVLFMVGLVLYLLPWLLAAAGVVLVVWLIVRGVRANRRAAELEADRLAAIVARADQQHQWVYEGDPRGTYGEPPTPETTKTPPTPATEVRGERSDGGVTVTVKVTVGGRRGHNDDHDRDTSRNDMWRMP